MAISSAIKQGWIDDWYAAAQECGVPLCDYLNQKRREATSGAATGAGRRIISASRAGESASYGDSDSDVIPQGEAVDFLATASQACPACQGTDEEKRDCLKATIAAGPARYVVKGFTDLRTCGC
jgi:hypothetical protein